MRSLLLAAVAALLALPARARKLASVSLPFEEIDLDLPPGKRWTAFAMRHRGDIVTRCQQQGQLYQRALGKDIAARWVKAATPSSELRAEYQGLVSAVNHSDVTFDCLVLTDMWQAVDAPSFGCTGLLAAMPDGRVIHGRNIDYDVSMMQKTAEAVGAAGTSGGALFDGVFIRGGRPLFTFLASTGSLGIHTGMRLGAYSIDSNARIINDTMLDNLAAHEAGGKNFPWVLRELLQTAPDFRSAVQTMEAVELNAPNYFILAGAGPYEGAVVTKDRFTTHNPLTPPTQWLSAARGVWYLVQTNDDLLHPPIDARRGAARSRLSQSRQSQVNMGFVLRLMEASPTTNSLTVATWVADPRAGLHAAFARPTEEFERGLLEREFHHALHVRMPEDLPLSGKQQGQGALRGSLQIR
mmetsp:Transcript_55800/g.172967  ORF Transcript_55800/g.172967 Transcript_55800/m.172967 type:complete len:411 (+) Transcript_55800:88-1320(+)